jgi:hypothetical protein
VTKYRDATELDAVEIVADRCALCGGKLVTRWFGVIAHSRHGYRTRAFPLRVCLGCKIAIQVRSLPGASLHATPKAARAAAVEEAARRGRAIGRTAWGLKP